MSKKTIVGFLVLALLVTVWTFLNNKPSRTEASVSQGSEYHSTSTREAITGVALTNYTVLANAVTQGVCTLGSVVITGANTGIINIYDATNTGNHADYGTTTLATIPASTAAGTYTFDVACSHGLLYELQSGLAPTSTITKRP